MDGALESVFAGYVMGGLLLLSRLALVLVVLPGFSDSSLPTRVKSLFAMTLTIVLDWGMGGIWVPVPEDVVTPVLLFGREAMLGAGIGMAVRLIIAAIEAAGAIAGSSMALSLNVLLDPSTGQQNLALGTLLGTVAALAFVALDGHHHVIYTLVAHLEAYPVGSEIAGIPGVEVIAQAGVQLGRTALLLAMPVVVVTLLIYVALALMGRLVPSMNLFGVGLGIVIGAGFLAMSMEGEAVVAAVERGIERLPTDAHGLTVGRDG